MLSSFLSKTVYFLINLPIVAAGVEGLFEGRGGRWGQCERERRKIKEGIKKSTKGRK